MKYDCSKCLDFVHEQERMCNDIEQEESCNGCGLDVLFGPCGTPDTQDKIDVVQNWSDEHPEPHKKTILEDFYEKFPDADINFKKMPLCCEVIYTGYTKCHECGNGCKQCWNRPLSEVQNEN